jgi:hypothetical protein
LEKSNGVRCELNRLGKLASFDLAPKGGPANFSFLEDFAWPHDLIEELLGHWSPHVEMTGDLPNKPETGALKETTTTQKSRDKSQRDLSRFDFLCLRWFCFTPSKEM